MGERWAFAVLRSGRKRVDSRGDSVGTAGQQRAFGARDLVDRRMDADIVYPRQQRPEVLERMPMRLLLRSDEQQREEEGEDESLHHVCSGY